MRIADEPAAFVAVAEQVLLEPAESRDARAAEAMAAIRQVNTGAQPVHTDDLGKMYSTRVWRTRPPSRTSATPRTRQAGASLDPATLRDDNAGGLHALRQHASNLDL